MGVRLLLGLGGLGFASGIALGALLLFHAIGARLGDQPPTEVTSPGDCPGVRLAISAPRVMSESESGAVEATLTAGDARPCTLEVWADAAPALDVRPTTPQTVVLGPAQPSGQARWRLNPSRPGSWDVRIVAGGVSETRRIKVTTILGLSPFATAVLSPVLAILGPMVTLPYWIDRWRQRPPSSSPRRSRRPA